MKKFLLTLIAAAFALALSACSGETAASAKPADDTPNGAPSQQQTQESEPVQEETSAPKADAFTVGDTVSLDDIAVTLVDVSESTGGAYVKPDDGKVFIICEFNIENNSDKDLAISSLMSFNAYIDDYATSLSLSALMSSDKSQLDGSVAAGKKLNGVIGFEADEDWGTIEVTFTPGIFFGDKATFVYSK